MLSGTNQGHFQGILYSLDLLSFFLLFYPSFILIISKPREGRFLGFVTEVSDIIYQLSYFTYDDPNLWN